MEETPLLEISHLNISFTQYTKGLRQKTLQVIRNLDVKVSTGEVVAIVGASGSGKSLLAHAVLGILPYNAKQSGKIQYCGQELTKERIEALRGKEIVFVPQSLSYMNPLMKIGSQIRKGKKDVKTYSKLNQIFSQYHLPQRVQEKYPFELSGGMNRRVLVATALIEEPKLVIADEPTPGMDLQLAKRAMGHLRKLAEDGAGVLVITHDLELAVETADRIVVFYDGQTIEDAKATDFEKEEWLRHPYTKALWRALPQNGFQETKENPNFPKNMEQGCSFASKCQWYQEQCRKEISYRQVREGWVRCLLDS